MSVGGRGEGEGDTLVWVVVWSARACAGLRRREGVNLVNIYIYITAPL